MPTLTTDELRVVFNHAFRAMNTTITLHISAEESDPKPAALMTQIADLFATAEEHLSRFRPESELSQLNREGMLAHASPLLFESVVAARDMAEKTGGVYDPTILPQLEIAGYDRSFEKIGRGGLYHIPAVIMPRTADYRSIVLDAQTRTITLWDRVRIDLGGIAKGRTADQAAQLLGAAGYRDYVIDAGGDIYSSGSAPQATQGWAIQVANPLNTDEALAAITLHNAAVATSSIVRRRWQRDGQVAHHLIDPRTGKSAATDVVAVSVIAPTAEQADVLAKTALILGSGAGSTFIEQQKGCAALFVSAAGTWTTTTRWPKEDDSND